MRLEPIDERIGSAGPQRGQMAEHGRLGVERSEGRPIFGAPAT
jgi:hypothetical protein